MPAVMHLTVLLSLFAVTVCTGSANSPKTEQVTATPTSAANPTGLTVTNESDVSLSPVKTTNHTSKPPTTLTLAKVSSSPAPSTSPQTPNTTRETHPSPQTAPTNQTFNETVSHGSTLSPAPGSPNPTAATTVNATSPAPSHDWDKSGLAGNPGLVAILCIFCVVLVLVLVVATVKCIRLPRSNFERLEDVPLGKVNEESPFAQYSK